MFTSWIYLSPVPFRFHHWTPPRYQHFLFQELANLVARFVIYIIIHFTYFYYEINGNLWGNEHIYHYKI